MYSVHTKYPGFNAVSRVYVQCPVSIDSVHRSYRKSSVHRQVSRVHAVSSVHTQYPGFIQCPVFIRSDLHLYIVSNAHTKSPGFMEYPVFRVHAQCPDFIRGDRCSCVMSESGNV